MKAVLYARVSSEKQDVDLSISAQLKALRDYAAKNSYQVIREFIDEAKSGRTAARPQFREMISLARRSPKPFDIVLVWKFSRFARDRYDSIAFKTLLGKNGVRVVSITEPFGNSPYDKLFEGMIESLDEFYSANLGEEVTRGMRECASRGFCVAPVVPYGYRKVKALDGSKERNKLAPEPSEAAIVLRLYQEVLKGNGLMSIVRGLNAECLPAPKGKGWLKTSVFKILTNETYTGTLLWSKTNVKGLPPIRVENAWEAIVDKETFDHVQTMLESRAPKQIHPRRLASPFLLSGLAKCGYCGRSLVGQDAKSGQFFYYVCSSLVKKGAGSCQARRLSKERFEYVVIEEIKNNILTPDNLIELVRLVNEDLDNEVTDSQALFESVSNELLETQRRLDRLYDAVEIGKVSMDDLAPRIKELRVRQAQLELKKAELETKLSDRHIELADKKVVERQVSEMHSLLEESELTLRKAFIRSFIKEITVTGNEAKMIYSMPALDTLTSEEESVLPIVHDGGEAGI